MKVQTSLPYFTTMLLLLTGFAASSALADYLFEFTIEDQSTCEIVLGIWSEPNTCTLDFTASISGNTKFEIAPHITLIIPGELQADVQGLILNYGTIILNEGRSAHISASSPGYADGVVDSYGTIINRRQLLIDGVFLVEGKGRPPHVSLENYGEIINNNVFYVGPGAKVHNEGQLVNNRAFRLEGGDLSNPADTDFDNWGEITNNSTFYVGSNGYLTLFPPSSYEGYAPVAHPCGVVVDLRFLEAVDPFVGPFNLYQADSDFPGTEELCGLDADLDGVIDGDDDLCPDTDLAGDSAPARHKRNRLWSAADGKFYFGDGTDSGITVEDTGGCSASQMIIQIGLGVGHVRFGISKSAMTNYLAVIFGAEQS